MNAGGRPCDQAQPPIWCLENYQVGESCFVSPKPIRNQYKADGNWQTYTRDFLKYIQTQDASLRELVKIAQATPA